MGPGRTRWCGRAEGGRFDPDRDAQGFGVAWLEDPELAGAGSSDPVVATLAAAYGTPAAIPAGVRHGGSPTLLVEGVEVWHPASDRSVRDALDAVPGWLPSARSLGGVPLQEVRVTIDGTPVDWR